MSAMDDLNKVTSVENGEVKSFTTINATSKDIKTTEFNMNANNNKSQGKHRFIKQEPKRSIESAGGVKMNPTKATKARTVVNQSEIPTKPEEEVQEVHLSPIDDILGTDNPNSLLNQYIEKKDKEASEWIAEKEEEIAVLKEEDPDAAEGILGEELDTVVDNRILVEDDDLDLDDSEEDKTMEKEEIDAIDEMIDTEDLPEPDELEEDNEEIAVDLDEEDSIEDDTEDEVTLDVEEEPYELDDEIDIEETEEASEPIVVMDEENDEEEEVVDDDRDEDEVLKDLQKMITDKIKPLSSTLNLASFTIAKKPVSNINNIVNDVKSRVVKWVLPNQGAIVKMKDFTGAEFEKLREYSENGRSVDSMNRRFKIIYDHIVSPKPQSFETWLKCTPFSDIDHYFFAIYIANYKGANFLPIDCQNKKCKNTWVTNDIDVMDMVKFNSDEDKKKFTNIYRSEETAATGKGIYVTQAVPLSENFAVAFREPSIYGMLEKLMIDDKTRDKYSAIVDYIPYIDAIYIIDKETNTLVPVSYKEFPDNSSRNVRSKIQKYASIFGTLSSDEFGPVKAYARALAQRDDGISYQYPELTCPKCKTVINSEVTSAEALVFTRYQLGSLTSTLLN